MVLRLQALRPYVQYPRPVAVQPALPGGAHREGSL
jgi:hypothetical protein